MGYTPTQNIELTGDPQAPTAAGGDSDQSVATTQFVQQEIASALSGNALAALSDVDVAGVVDGALLRYEGSSALWADTGALLLSDSGQLQVTTDGIAAGILIGTDGQWYRSALNTIRSPNNVQIGAAFTADGESTFNDGAIFNAFMRFRVRPSIVTGAYTANAASDFIIRVNSSGGGFTIALPATHTAGQTFILKDVGGMAGTNPINVDPSNGDTIDGNLSINMNVNYQTLILTSDGTNWMRIV